MAQRLAVRDAASLRLTRPQWRPTGEVYRHSATGEAEPLNPFGPGTYRLHQGWPAGWCYCLAATQTFPQEVFWSTDSREEQLAGGRGARKGREGGVGGGGGSESCVRSKHCFLDGGAGQAPKASQSADCWPSCISHRVGGGTAAWEGAHGPIDHRGPFQENLPLGAPRWHQGRCGSGRGAAPSPPSPETLHMACHRHHHLTGRASPGGRGRNGARLFA